MKRALWLFLILLSMLLYGCAKSARYEASPSMEAEMAPPAPPPSVAMQAPGGAADYRAAPAPTPPSPRREESRSGTAKRAEPPKPSATATTPSQPEQPKATPKRMVYYNGYAQLRVTKVSESLDEAVKLVTKVGGYVERLTSTGVTLRVPVASFKEVYAQLLGLGDVMRKSVTAEDVTDAFMAVDLRLQTAMATRERLLELLAKARSEEEKLQLLREIQRVTEEIDGLQTQIKTLESLASFSRITLELVQRQAGGNRTVTEEVGAFRWVQQLSAFQRTVSQDSDLLTLQVPQGLVALDEKKHFVAESADGAVLWTALRKNEPKGDTAFWMDAIQSRLKDDFATAEVKDVGAFKVLRLVDRSDKPYRYLVAVCAQDDKLWLVEVYYPTEEQEKRYNDAVMASISKGAL